MWMSSGKLGKRRSWRGGGDSKGDREEMFRDERNSRRWYPGTQGWNYYKDGKVALLGQWDATGHGIYMEMICNLEESNLLLSRGKAWLKWVKEMVDGEEFETSTDKEMGQMLAEEVSLRLGYFEWTSLAIQWLRLAFLLQGVCVWSLVRSDPTSKAWPKNKNKTAVVLKNLF